MKPIALFIAVCAFIFGSCPLRADDNEARLPYKLIYEIQEKQTSLAHSFTNLQVFIRMKSSLTNVHNSDLRVYVDSKEGKLPVTLDTNGIFSIPMRDSLLAENPPIIVNQPKGTMELAWYVGLVEPEKPTNGIRYGTMMRPLKDLEAIRAQMVPGVVSSVRGMIFYFPDDVAEAAIVIHAKNGDRTYKTDASHTVIIPWEQTLLEENPVINFSSPPLKFDVANDE
jgi:hypothetical protein